MATSLQFRVRGRLDLDGTHKAVVETDDPSLRSLQTRLPAGPLFVQLHQGGRDCCCFLAEVKEADENLLWVDRYKQRTLDLKDGDRLDLTVVSPASATRAHLRVPPDFSDRDVARIVGKPLCAGETTAVFTFSGEPRPIRVVETSPQGIVVLEPATEIVTSPAEQDEDSQGAPVTYRDVGGLDREIKMIREAVEYPLRFPELFRHLGITQPRGIILHGPPGTGKTLIARALSHEVGAKFYSINGPEVFSKWYGESERQLREIFEEAAKNAPAVVLIDELDALVPKRETSRGELEQRIVASLLTLMDGITKREGVVVIGTTNRVNAIDLALRREGRFGNEIHVGVPDVEGRQSILEIHTRRIPLADDVDMALLARRSVGFVGADIAQLCREAAYNTLRRSYSAEQFDQGKIEAREDLKVSQADFEAVLPGIAPSAMKEFLVQVPKVTWDQVGGLEEVRQILMENVAYPITKRDVFRKAGITPAKGILLYGPPGTGKTLVAKAVAHECGANFIAVKGPEILSKWLGESEERIRALFAKAREVTPCVLFFDEIDAAAPSRGQTTNTTTDTIVNQILSEMDGVEGAEGVFVIGATNRPELLDPALLRPGRFDFQVEIPLPDEAAREAIFRAHLAEKPTEPDLDLGALAEMSHGMSGADIAGACRQAAMSAIRDAEFEADKLVIGGEHLRGALQEARQTAGKLRANPIGFVSGGRHD